ncbi:hypothetical protein N9V70_00965 [Candidatus Pelagibacter bacterium]|jgi:hypothetical protein|nr:hypothetical protein [Candidatus Pelagibacter bacterium]
MKTKPLEIVITDHSKGGLSFAGLGGRYKFFAREIASGVYRVKDGQADFTFLEEDLFKQEWVKEV